jgi:tRNA threonylcarbamoyladenosine biosynthesis protein TsaB
MARILNIETSTFVCSVNIAENGNKIIGRETHEQNAHSKILTVFIEEILNETAYKISSFDAVAVSKGPGSYTGLRIGVSAAKGIVYGGGIKLLSVNTLQSMAWGAKKTLDISEPVLFAPMIDARRMEVYTQLYDINLKPVNKIKALVVDENSFKTKLNSHKICFFGDGADKCKHTILHKNAIFYEHIHPSADYMIHFSENLFNEKKFEDLAYFEPFYLKDFVATIPTKNIFR